MMQAFLKPLKDQIRMGFMAAGRPLGQTGHNAALSYNLLHGFNAEGEIDPSKIMISSGTLPGPEQLDMEIQPGSLVFSWKNHFENDRDRGLDQVILAVYHREKSQVLGVAGGSNRKQGSETISIEGLYGSLDIWIGFVSNDRKDASPSTYMGCFNISPPEGKPTE